MGRRDHLRDGVVAVVIVSILTACTDAGGDASMTARPSDVATVRPTREPQSTNAAPSEPGATIKPDSFAELNVATEVFETPGDVATTWTSIERNTLVYVISQDGDWYHVEFPLFGAAAVEYVFGWIEGTRDGRPALRPVALTPCPDAAPDVTWLTGMTPAERLRCFGTESLQLRGVLDRRSLPGASYDGDPAWLAREAEFALLGNQGPALEGGGIELHFSPETDHRPYLGINVVVTAHFDDPSSTTCQRRPAADSVPEQTVAESVLWCRQQLVVDGIELD